MSRPSEQFDPGRAGFVAGSAVYGFDLSRRVDATVSTRLEPPTGEHQTFVGAVLARKSWRWYLRVPWWTVPPKPDWPRSVAAFGSTFGSLWVQLEPVAHRLWIGAEPIVIPDGDNIVFLRRPDDGRPPLELAGTTRLHAELSPMPNAAGRSSSRVVKAEVERIRELLLSSPDVRRFIEASTR